MNVNVDKNAKGDCLVHSVVRGGFPCLPYLLFLTCHLQADVNKENAQGMTALCLTAQLDQHMLAEVRGLRVLPLMIHVCLLCAPQTLPNKYVMYNSICLLFSSGSLVS